MTDYKFSDEDWAACIRVLEALKDSPFENPDNDRFKTPVTKIHRQVQKQKRRSNATAKREHDDALVRATEVVNNARNQTTQYGFVAARNAALSTVHNLRYCYCCKAPYTRLYFFHHRLCPDCAVLNYDHRMRVHDLWDIRS